MKLKNRFKKNILIWISVFVVITISIFALSKFGLTGPDTTVAVNTYGDPSSAPTIDPIDITDKNAHLIPEPTIMPTPEIDYDAIPGLTNEKVYSKQLVEKGSKNILFVGMDKINGLYDTIGIVSIDKKNEKIKLIMIPRDLHIDYNLKVRHYLDINGKNRPDFYKINSAHFIGPYLKYQGKFGPYSMNFLTDVIKEKFGIVIDDYIRINPDGFVELVDLFGGVNINVPYAMNYDDPFQDLSIHLEEGMQPLDGKQAEGFVRFRQYYDEENKLKQIGDIERKKNQLDFIKAFINQHGTISNIDKLPGVINTLNKNMKHSIGVGDLLMSYLGHAKDAVIKKYSIESITISGKGKVVDGAYYIFTDD